MHIHWYARLTCIWVARVGVDKEGRHCVACTRLQAVTIIGDEIRWKEFNYSVNSHLINLRSNSSLIFTVKATSDGHIALLEGCLCFCDAIIIVFHSFWVQYFKPLIWYIFSISVENPLWEWWMHCNAKNIAFSIRWHQLGVHSVNNGSG
jgi:hypothetical protein